MNTVLTLLAVSGITAAAWHLVRAALRFLREAAADIWAGEMAETQARRGDLTALEESKEKRATARRSGARSGLAVAAWLAVLVAPAFTPWPRAVYASLTLLFLEPAVRRLR